MADDDVISNLPEDILSSILSYLTLRDATRARVLSPRWRDLSPSATNFQFDLFTLYGIDDTKVSDKFYSQEQDSKFVRAVNQILQDFCKIPKIDSFGIRYPLGDKHASEIDRWIRIAIGMQTKKLELEIGRYFCRRIHQYNFPSKILLQTSHLKYLCLQSCVMTQTAIDDIFSSCMNLEFFKLICCTLPGSVLISGKQSMTTIYLKEMVLENCSKNFFELEEIEISSLNIATFEYRGNRVALRFVNTLILGEARLWGVSRCFAFDQLSKQPPLLPVSSLLLNTNMMSMSPIPDKLTKFWHLKELELLVDLYPRFDLLSITIILEACPVLHKFCLALKHNIYSRIVAMTPREITYQAHKGLREIEVYGFRNRCNATKLVLYLLNACTGLERMNIDFHKTWNLRRPRKWFIHDCSKDEKEQLRSVLSGHVNSKVDLSIL